MGALAHTVATAKQAARAVDSLMDGVVLRVEQPRRTRGNPAESFRCWLKDGRSVIATCRPTATRTSFEAHVLRQLDTFGADVPRIFAAEGAWLLQEDLGSERLSKALAISTPARAAPLLSHALDALCEVHRAGRAAGLDHDAPKPEHRDALFAQISRLSEVTRTDPPRLNIAGLEAAVDVVAPDAFIKSDARPARALVSDGRPVWFDWAHCARGRRVQDLIWVLGDEALPDWPELEAELLDAHLPRFINSIERGRSFFAVYGVLHLCRRMASILALRDESQSKGPDPLGTTLTGEEDAAFQLGGWWPASECLDADHPIVTPDAFTRLRTRAERWASQHFLTSPMQRWFRSMLLPGEVFA